MTGAKLRCVLFTASFASFASLPAFAQSSPSTGAFPETEPAPAPSSPPPATDPAAPAPAPTTASPAQPATYPATDPAAPPPAAPAPPPPAEPTAPAQMTAYPAYSDPPPPPERPRDEGFEMPPFSVRVDPFNWLLEGKLGFELEVALLDFLSVELVPVFVANSEPPTFQYVRGRDDGLARDSDGLGPLAGTSIGVGFWLEGKPLRGYVLRAILTNYGYEYTARDDGVVVDRFSHVERHFYGFIGSHSRWGAFTLSGGFGLGAELNQQNRCFPEETTDPEPRATSDCADGQMSIKLDRGANRIADVSGGLGGVQLLVRFSLGVSID